ncbi:BMP and activin membrane-bound inhibitor-like protein [Elysia marginata]|uniref:BMP and activin membrane-bound inhibitor-like protein n=1 Tax=Elysia marginata TaxID=1093978 RepID=A0AAV4G1L0_9GAST|nr:BMP and activin membrane-bound inhibitor-like protein [Elysia marginata]
MTTCIARKSCYAELYQNELNRGCDPTPLACENRRPSGLQQLEWPALYCCRHKNLCNKNAVPTISTSGGDKLGHQVDKDTVPYTPEDSDDFLEQEEEPAEEPSFSEPNCSDPDPEQRARARTKIVNPIYIAVPVAGVCVLLALIIFAMYLLRRRTDYHHPHDSSFNSHHHFHHDQSGTAGVPGHKKGSLGQQQESTPSEERPSLIPHHCHCVCKKQPIVALPPCGKNVNRCTDSERSSSGSETRLFLQS